MLEREIERVAKSDRLLAHWPSPSPPSSLQAHNRPLARKACACHSWSAGAAWEASCACPSSRAARSYKGQLKPRRGLHEDSLALQPAFLLMNARKSASGGSSSASRRKKH